MKKAIILLSGGLDSLVSLAYPQNDYIIEKALTFDYGQKALNQELVASKSMCEYYKIEHQVIKLDWLRDISNSTLVSEGKIPNDEDNDELLWIPNRNGLFLNIAASFADSYGYNYIIYGANKDEAESFSDNTEKFRNDITHVFETSTLVKPVVIAPLINYSKNDIVRIAIENKMPLEYVRSCYDGGVKHCGKCASCVLLKKALIANNGEKYLDILF